MLILVAVIINMVIKGGLFTHAENAVRETKNAIGKEQDLGRGKIKIGDVEYDSIDEYLNGSKIKKITFGKNIIIVLSDYYNYVNNKAQEERETWVRDYTGVVDEYFILSDTGVDEYNQALTLWCIQYDLFKEEYISENPDKLDEEIQVTLLGESGARHLNNLVGHRGSYTYYSPEDYGECIFRVYL